MGVKLSFEGWSLSSQAGEDAGAPEGVSCDEGTSYRTERLYISVK